MKSLITLTLALFTSCLLYAQKRPNIIFVMSDDHAYQAISAYGAGLNNTPNIDKLASNGILFNNAFVNNSLCAPSRAAIMTGKFSHLNGIKGNGNEIFDGSQSTFPKLLQKNGYQTALVGKWHLNSDPTGFDYWNILPGQGSYYNPDFIINGKKKRVEGYVTDLTTDDAINWMDGRDKEKPFCIMVWNKAPHRDWMPAIKYLKEFKDTKFPVPFNFFDEYNTRTRAPREQTMEISKWLSPNYDLKENFNITGGDDPLDKSWEAIFARLNPEEQKAFKEAYGPENDAFKKANLTGKELAIWKFQRYMKDYLRCIQSVDDNVGRLTDYLSKNGLTENTIVIYTSDQGFYLGEHGWFDKRFMYDESFKTPLIMSWPKVIKGGRVSNDLVMNLDIAETLLDAANIKIPADMQGESMLPILKNEKNYKSRDAVYYHYYEYEDEHHVAKHIGVRTHKYKLIWFYENKEWELFDLEKDKNEMNNVYGKPAYLTIQNEMKKELAKLQVKYKDPEPALVN